MAWYIYFRNPPYQVNMAEYNCLNKDKATKSYVSQRKKRFKLDT